MWDEAAQEMKALLSRAMSKAGAAQGGDQRQLAAPKDVPVMMVMGSVSKTTVNITTKEPSPVETIGQPWVSPPICMASTSKGIFAHVRVHLEIRVGQPAKDDSLRHALLAILGIDGGESLMVSGSDQQKQTP